jgi:hypothetical protein
MMNWKILTKLLTAINIYVLRNGIALKIKAWKTGTSVVPYPGATYSAVNFDIAI